jgi:AcrR family transcriptional regulator
MEPAREERLDRRRRRRQETIDEILEVAAAIITESGAGALSLGDVARRVGIRPPSLYEYFDSKNALYDALFARGATAVLQMWRQARLTVLNQAQNFEEALLLGGTAFLRWRVENPGYSELLFWRPVPGFTPSPEAYGPAIETIEDSRQLFGEFQQRGWLRADVPADQVLRDWTVIIAGIGSQQQSNAPHEPFETGAFTTRLPELTAMFARHYGAPSTTSKNGRTSHARSR